jgi:hypothetical protein
MDACMSLVRWIFQTPLVLWPLMASIALVVLAEWRAQVRWAQGWRWSR